MSLVRGVLQRGGKVIAGVVKNQKRSSLQPNVRQNVESGSTVYTGALKSYEGLSDEFMHEMIDHAKEYVRGNCHTNGIENFWSLLKRCLNGAYISVMPWHLKAYVDEQVFRFNERKVDDSDRFDAVMSRASRRRLTYAALIE